MNEAEFQIEQGRVIMQELMRAYVELNKLHAQPGDKCHMLAGSIHFIEKILKELLRERK